MLFLEIFLTALITALLELAAHAFTALYLPHLGRLKRYALGILAIGLPFSGLLAWWSHYNDMLAFWILVVISGAAVWGAYRIGEIIRKYQAGREALEREDAQTEKADRRAQ